MKITRPKVTRLSLAKALETLLESGARQTIVYQHPRLCVKATRRFKPSARMKTIDIVLTIGEPNYEGRKFVKRCLAAGEPFPVKRVQLKFWPGKKR